MSGYGRLLTVLASVGAGVGAGKYFGVFDKDSGKDKSSKNHVSGAGDVKAAIARLQEIEQACSKIIPRDGPAEDRGLECGSRVAALCRAKTEPQREAVLHQAAAAAAGFTTTTAANNNSSASNGSNDDFMLSPVYASAVTDASAAFKTIFKAVHHFTHAHMSDSRQLTALPGYYLYYEPVLVSAYSLVERQTTPTAVALPENLIKLGDSMLEYHINLTDGKDKAAVEAIRAQRSSTYARIRSERERLEQAGALLEGYQPDAIALSWLDDRAYNTPEMYLAEVADHKKQIVELREACRAVTPADTPASELGLACGLWFAAAKRAGNEGTEPYQRVYTVFRAIPTYLLGAWNAYLEARDEGNTALARELVEKVFTNPEIYTLVAPVGLCEDYLSSESARHVPPMWRGMMGKVMEIAPTDGLQACSVGFEETVQRVEAERVRLKEAGELKPAAPAN